MPTVLIAVAAAIALYLAFVAILFVAGRRHDARAFAGFVPDCAVLFTRLLGDSRVPRRSKLLLAALVVYLSVPFDLIPDFIPVVGYLDDAILVILVLRVVLRESGPSLLETHWPGPKSSLDMILRVTRTPPRAPAPVASPPAPPAPGGTTSPR
jgi:uncharacterized membrane protein YkvA (DUF1232 family)